MKAQISPGDECLTVERREGAWPTREDTQETEFHLTNGEKVVREEGHRWRRAH